MKSTDILKFSNNKNVYDTKQMNDKCDEYRTTPYAVCHRQGYAKENVAHIETTYPISHVGCKPCVELFK